MDRRAVATAAIITLASAGLTAGAVLAGADAVGVGSESDPTVLDSPWMEWKISVMRS